jgi:hypothetical protein
MLQVAIFWMTFRIPAGSKNNIGFLQCLGRQKTRKRQSPSEPLRFLVFNVPADLRPAGHLPPVPPASGEKQQTERHDADYSEHRVVVPDKLAESRVRKISRKIVGGPETQTA